MRKSNGGLIIDSIKERVEDVKEFANDVGAKASEINEDTGAGKFVEERVLPGAKELTDEATKFVHEQTAP
ncbi:hypothetical protein niasHS_011223 [Heterodera schachtii]|uniref:Uncharacterized protein n=1 Tax=Heterodera schachtii TaxID=97005 RepID=A0ABD2IVS5_HETSC